MFPSLINDDVGNENDDALAVVPVVIMGNDGTMLAFVAVFSLVFSVVDSMSNNNGSSSIWASNNASWYAFRIVVFCEEHKILQSQFLVMLDFSPIFFAVSNVNYPVGVIKGAKSCWLFVFCV